MKKSFWRSAAAVVMAIAMFFFILTVSIGLPIYIRPFYYAHIQALELPQASGFTAQQIREAFDEVMDYLTLPGKEFGVGDMAYTEDGKAHFADCKVLFDLNAGVLIASAVCIVILFFLRKKWGPYRLGKRSAAFYAAVFAVVLPLVVGALAATDFDKAFLIFHTLFFPGKDNWYFYEHLDQIVTVLPQQFFMNCAVLIGAGVLTMATAILIWEFITSKKCRGGS